VVNRNVGKRDAPDTGLTRNEAHVAFAAHNSTHFSARHRASLPFWILPFRLNNKNPNLQKRTYKIIESSLYNPTYYKLRLLFTNCILLIVFLFFVYIIDSDRISITKFYINSSEIVRYIIVTSITRFYIGSSMYKSIYMHKQILYVLLAEATIML